MKFVKSEVNNFYNACLDNVEFIKDGKVVFRVEGTLNRVELGYKPWYSYTTVLFSCEKMSCIVNSTENIETYHNSFNDMVNFVERVMENMYNTKHIVTYTAEDVLPPMNEDDVELCEEEA